MAKTILITGANRGIGLELAKRALARGDRVIATCRSPGAAPALEELRHHRGDLTIHGADVTKPDQLAAVADAERAAIDLLVCNAGQYMARGGIDDPQYTVEAWQDVLMTNVAGVFFSARAFLPQLEADLPGKIAVVSSVMASHTRAPGGSYIYRASKAAATNIARNLAAELRPRGIAVGAYHPGWVRTDMGGGAADIDVGESAEGLLGRFDALSMESTGVFEDYRGDQIPY